MHSLWNDTDAAALTNDLALRVYSSRLLGQEPALVLHGGGNTSVKVRETNTVGEQEDLLYVKGSGWDLATIEAPGYVPVRLAHLLKLAQLEELSDSAMVNELKTHTTIASAPTPSVEAILHAALPYKFVDHTHADAVVTITNTPDGEARIRALYGDRVVVIPYVMPGFDLARLVATLFAKQSGPHTVGMVLMNHGIFSFGESAKESYERMIQLVTEAEDYLAENGAWILPEPVQVEDVPPLRENIARLRADISAHLGAAAIVSRRDDPRACEFARRDDLARIAQQGPATPDHVIRTKRVPMLGRDVATYASDYRTYFQANAAKSRVPVTMLDPAPRVILDRALGTLTVGRSSKEADIVGDIYRHTIDIISRAEKLDRWQALPEFDIFEVEYWELEQAKLNKGGKSPMFQGEVALVTGAASGIGRACVESLLKRGAAVVGLDLNPEIINLLPRSDFLGVRCDVTDMTAIQAALESAVRRFGGLDMVVLNAGMFPGGRAVAELDDELWRKVMAVNLDANLSVLRESYPLLKLAPNKGRVAVVGSKNVPAPGPGAAAYSASKAALNQLIRVSALEWAKDGIRINSVHPDAVFDTGLWTDEVLAARAAHYGMTVEAYKTKNLLRTEVHSADVAEMVAEMLGPLFAKTTAAQVPIDGGNDRVI
ncbi:MAG: bifunctional aldolase/short-chain dehydrogenase [Gammaproteobacteria bacterium]|nr:bifunctional aldolase/short-chain dehydrogenase [Gammaproteobacteria bacterium]MCP5135572.1 bifunctional aldolase/short-chain dehydrogenase [Gammaproteobacteria bacterium]